jgi:hypothetical protein
VDNGIDPIEYTFKCAKTNFLCGNEVDGTLCNDGVDETVKATEAECEAMITGMLDPNTDTYSVKCPNGNAISHYVVYDCHGTDGIKYEKEMPDGERCSRRRNLRSNKTGLKFW